MQVKTINFLANWLGQDTISKLSMFFLFVMLTISATIFFPRLSEHDVYAHFFGETIDVDDGRFQVVFAPYPETPAPEDNSTRLNFSILQNNSNIYNIHAAVVIREKPPGQVVDQIPYRLYEFSDIIIPYTFHESGEYVVTLQTRIIGDEKYQVSPMVTSFDLSVSSPNQVILSDRVALTIIVVVAIIGTGGAVFVRVWKKM